MKSKGIVLSATDHTIKSKARSAKLPLVVDPALPLSFGKTLFTEPGTGIPWDLLSAGWHFLERWDAAVPLWRYGKTAQSVGTKAERKQTIAVIRDLRVLLHSVELLFVRANEPGQALMDAYRQELEAGGDKRLAFLRAYYQVKPRLCVLPRSWLAEVAQRARRDHIAMRGQRRKTAPLVEIELSPGRFVKCHAGDEDKVRAQLGQGRGQR